MEKIICKICNLECSRYCSLGAHIKRTHKLTLKEYYDKYVEPGVEHKCLYCRKDTAFFTLQDGYRKYCSIRCSAINANENGDAKKKREETCLKKYGSKCFLGSKYLDRSVNYGGTPESIAKIKATKLARHGNENYCNMEKVYETKKKRYGDPFYSNREQARKTCFEHYGVEYPNQNHDIRTKAQRKNIIYNGIRFDSSWELAYYLYLIKNKIEFEYQPKIVFQYKYNGKMHYYMPDFKVGNEFIEIKGTHFFENKDGTGKMINPYDHSLDEAYEAKHQCMLRNNVKIITDCKEYMHELDGIEYKTIDVECDAEFE